MRYSDDYDEIGDLIVKAETCEEAENAIRTRVAVFLTLCTKPLVLDVARYINSKMKDEHQNETLRN